MSSSEFYHLVKKQYLKYKKVNRNYVIMCFFLFVIMSLEMRVIKNNTFWGIPNVVSDYMLDVFVDKFDVNFFYLMATEFLSGAQIYLLIAIYYTYNFLFLSSPILIIVSLVLIVMDGKRKGKEEYRYLQVCELLENIKNLIGTNKIRRVYRYDSSFGKNLYIQYSPLRADYYSNKNYEWYKNNSISRESHEIMISLKNFGEKVIFSTKNNVYIDEVVEGLDSLCTYMFLMIQFNSGNEVCSYEERVRYLARFGKKFRCIKVSYANKDKASKYIVFLKRILKGLYDYNMHIVIVIAVVMALLLMLGSKAFDLSKDVAFQTWILSITASIASLIVAKVKSSKES